LIAQDLRQFKKEEAWMFLHSKLASSTVSHGAGTTYYTGLGASTTAQVLTMRGFIQDMRDNAPANCCRDISGSMTFSEFYDIIGNWAFQSHSKQLLLSVGRKMALGMGLWKDKKVLMTSSEKQYNLILTSWEVAPGKVITVNYDSSLDVPDVGTPTRGEMMIGLDLGTDEGENYSPQILASIPNRAEEVTLSNGTRGKATLMQGMWTMIMPHQEAQLFVEGIQDVTP
jgi:hypothetical protein